MIETDIRTFLLADTDIAAVVSTRVFGGKVPQGTTGAVIVLRNISGNRHYHLTNEATARESLVQIDCYQSSMTLADALAELVRNRLSGYRGAAGSTTVQAATIISERAFREEPQNASDRWIYRSSADYSIIYSTTAPTHA